MENLKDHIKLRRKGSNTISHPVIRLNKVNFSYAEEFALTIDHLEIARGSMVAVTGASGCGKTTFIKLLAGILHPDSGQILVDDLDLTTYGKEELQDIRILKAGLVFQEFTLLEYLDIVDNVTLPLRINPVLKYTTEQQEQAKELLRQVGLETKLGSYPRKLSQGERQRVAVCRSMIANPGILLYDEPTANLDAKNRDAILRLVSDYCQSRQATLVMVTHDRETLDFFDREIELSQFHHDHKTESR